MSFDIKTLSEFEKELKRLSKKYPSLKLDYQNLLESLLENPQQGTPLGKDLYKIRMSITGKRQGKSGGARVITCVKVVKRNYFFGFDL